MSRFRGFLLLIWIVLASITYLAISTLGFAEMMVVLTDLANLWRVQIYTDFIFHGFVFIGWIMYREESRRVGIMCALGVLTFGGLFTFIYLLATTFRAKGDMKKLLLGENVSTYASHS